MEITRAAAAPRGATEQFFDARIEPARALRAFAYGGEQSRAARQRQGLGGAGGVGQGFPVLLQRLAPGLQRIGFVLVEMHAGQVAFAQQRQGFGGITLAHRTGQRRQLQGVALAIAALQLHAGAGEGVGLRFDGVAGQLAQQGLQRARIVNRNALAVARCTQDGAEHVAGFHRRQLVGVAEQHQAGAVGDGFDQLGHQRQVDHRSFVDHDHVVGQRVVGVMAEARRIGNHAEQAMQGGAGARQLVAQCGVDAGGGQLLHGITQAFGHALGGAAGGRGQGDARCGFTFGLRLRGEQHQQAGDGGGLAGTGAAGDQQQVVAQGGGCGAGL
ncbi:hypothetical protein D3C81_1168350 [compost metagenome]